MAQETAKSKTSLFVFTPRFLAGLSLASIGIGWIFALLVWANPLGFGATLFFSTIVGTALYFSRQTYYRKNKAEMNEVGWPTKRWIQSYESSYYLPLWLAAWQIVVSFAFLYRVEVYTSVFLWIFYLITLPALLAFLFFPVYPRAVTIFNGIVFSLKYAIFSVVEGIKFIWEGPMNIFPFFRRRVFRMIVLGLLLGLFLILFFGWLLSAADPVFKSYFDRIWDEIVNFIKYLELFKSGRLFILILAPLVIAGGFFAIARYKLSNLYEVSEEKLTKWLARKEITTRRLSDFAFNAIVLTAVNLVFWGFVLIQIRYFFFGSDLTNILGKYTYAQYAQRGFSEMLIAVIFAYPLLAWFANRSSFNNKVVGWLASLANMSLVGALVIVLFSALRRISLYQSTYGYSLRRLFVILGVMVVGTVLFGHIGLIVYKKLANVKRQFRFIALNEHFFLAVVGLAILFTLTVMIPWPRFVHQANINRYKETGKIDLVYMYTAPEEAIPVLATFVQDMESNKITVKGVSADQAKQTATLLRANLENRLIAVNKEVVRRVNKDGQVEGSILAKIGGFNIIRFYNAHTLYDKLVGPKQQTKTDDMLRQAVTRFVEQYGQTMVAGDYDNARKFWDPTFTPTSLTALNDSRVTAFTLRYPIDASQADSLRTEGLINSVPVDVTISRTTLHQGATHVITTTIVDFLTISVQNGQLVIKSADKLPLAYQDYECDTDSVYQKCDTYFDNAANRRKGIDLEDLSF